jgi:hypothetical protein
VKAQGSLGQCRSIILGILRHWVKYPDAKDSCDGISKWWLPEGALNSGQEKVQQALDMLVLEGWVTERKSRSAQKIYGLNKDRLKEIEKFLRQSENGN